jgi:beta-lactamase regulating signal transducer with metallopeptidase domain
MPGVTRLRFGFDVLIIALFGATAYMSLDFRELAQYMPLYISLLALILAFTNLIVDLVRWRATGTAVGSDTIATAALREDDPEEAGEVRATFARVVRYLGWVLGYVLLIWVIGLVPATAVFLVAFLVIEARMRLVLIAIGTVLTLAALMGISELMNLFWPPSLL